MKKFVLLVLCYFVTLAVQAETLKMKDGSLISGSILSQTEYTLNLATSYGNITLNQRDIEQILPDKHRLILKGGSQLVGIILDMDEFNLKLQTDEGAVVNIDMPQIVSIEAYDYDRGKNAQQEFVEKKIEQEQQAKVAQEAAQAAAATGAVTAGGLTFDSDIDQVFNARKAAVVNGQVQTPSAQIQQAAAKPLSDEEAFLKNVKSGAISPKEYAAAAKEELSAKKAQAKTTPKSVKRVEKNFSKYFAVQIGAIPLDLKAKGELPIGSDTIDLGDEGLDMGKTGVAVSSKFLWRVKESNLWLGPTVSFFNISNKKYNLQSGTDAYELSSSGSAFALGAAANYYINPKSRFAFYLTGTAQYEMLSLNYHGLKNATTAVSDSVSSNGLSGAAGVGVETWIDDLMLGLEVRQVFSPRKKVLKDSAASNTVAQVQLSWKF